MKKLGLIIKDRRSMLGITQLDLAEISGVGLRTITDIERGNGNPSINTIEKVLDVLGLEIDVKVKTTVE